MKPFLILMLLLCVPKSFAGKELPPVPQNYVYSDYKRIDASDIARLSDFLAKFQRQSGRALAVAFFSSLDGEDIDDYSNRLFRHWCGPDKKSCEGILLVVSFGDRKYRTEVGYGLEGILTDVQTSRIQKDKLVPALRSGKPIEGVMAVGNDYLALLQGQILEPAPAKKSNLKPLYLMLFFLISFLFYFFHMLRDLVRFKKVVRGKRRQGLWGTGWDYTIGDLRHHTSGGSWGSQGGGGFGGFSGGHSGSSGGGGSSGSW